MAENFSVTNEIVDPILANVITVNQDKVVGWIYGEPGAWGFLSGQAVANVRDRADRRLTDQERRLVWSRMWWWLEQVKARMGNQS
ncbi:MAG: hypothetical protein BZY83_00965 [SAR202 cluster bacterium Casp-Chloro-G2]|nr:MAG: hypothetical protein BZY83_00965 [SAR202 cluster bacterium Casp-Chloro-G2]